jgi:DNA-binding transcriptional regulator YbjK
MRGYRVLGCVVFLAAAVWAQDWQECKPEGDYSFNDVKAAIHRVMSTQMYSSWDEKMFYRSGDLVAVAVLKTLDDSEMADPDHAKDVLRIIRAAFACPERCVKVSDDRRPRMALLLLEHLNEITGGKMQADIEEVRHFILQQALRVSSHSNCQMEGIIYQNGVPIRFCTKG